MKKIQANRVVVVGTFMALISLHALAEASAMHSAARAENEDFTTSAKRIYHFDSAPGVPSKQERLAKKGGQNTDQQQNQSAYRSAVPFAKLNDLIAKNQPQSSPDTLSADEFAEIRDAFTFPNWQLNNQNFPRHTSFMYPDDGCFDRAEIMRTQLLQAGKSTVMKVFAFGNLKVNSINAAPGSNGTVTWWYHVAPVIWVKPSETDANNQQSPQPMVMDPSLNPDQLMSISQWVNLMTLAAPVDQISVNICQANTYTPNDSCESPQSDNASSAESDEMTPGNGYLALEWQRQTELNHHPEALLVNKSVKFFKAANPQ